LTKLSWRTKGPSVRRTREQAADPATDPIRALGPGSLRAASDRGLTPVTVPGLPRRRSPGIARPGYVPAGASATLLRAQPGTASTGSSRASSSASRSPASRTTRATGDPSMSLYCAMATLAAAWPGPCPTCNPSETRDLRS